MAQPCLNSLAFSAKAVLMSGFECHAVYTGSARESLPSNSVELDQISVTLLQSSCTLQDLPLHACLFFLFMFCKAFDCCNFRQRILQEDQTRDCGIHHEAVCTCPCLDLHCAMKAVAVRGKNYTRTVTYVS